MSKMAMEANWFANYLSLIRSMDMSMKYALRLPQLRLDRPSALRCHTPRLSRSCGRWMSAEDSLFSRVSKTRIDQRQ